jgi:hypothetical protein
MAATPNNNDPPQAEEVAEYATNEQDLRVRILYQEGQWHCFNSETNEELECPTELEKRELSRALKARVANGEAETATDEEGVQLLVLQNEGEWYCLDMETNETVSCPVDLMEALRARET